MFTLLRDRPSDPAREVLPVDDALGDGMKHHASVPHGLDPIPGLKRIEASKAILIPTENDGEPPFRAVRHHLLEPQTLLCRIARDPGIDVLSDDLVSAVLSELRQCLALAWD